MACEDTRSGTFHHLRIRYRLLDLGEYAEFCRYGDGEVGMQSIDCKGVYVSFGSDNVAGVTY